MFSLHRHGHEWHQIAHSQGQIFIYECPRQRTAVAIGQFVKDHASNSEDVGLAPTGGASRFLSTLISLYLIISAFQLKTKCYFSNAFLNFIVLLTYVVVSVKKLSPSVTLLSFIAAIQSFFLPPRSLIKILTSLSTLTNISVLFVISRIIY